MFSFTNSNDLRELAIYYERKKMFPYMDEYNDLYEELNMYNKKGDKPIWPDITQMSDGARDLAKHWIKRFIVGESIGGVPYCAEHLFYMNVCQIERSVDNDEGIFKQKSKRRRKVATRDLSFPDFWDEDYKYFMTCHIAKHGVHEWKLKDLDGNELEDNVTCYRRVFVNVGIDLGLVEDEDNLDGGLNHVYLKPRGVGFSWKMATFNNYNLFLVPNMHNFIFGHSNEYLGDKDGAMIKFTKVRSFIQAHAWFLRRNFSKESISDYTFSTGFKESIGGAEIVRGFNSSVSGVVIDGEPDKVRGKRGNGTFEEFGSFPLVDKAWETFDSGMTEGDSVFGQARGGGTGGGKADDYAALEKMTYSPSIYRIIRFKNPYEDKYRGTGIAMFTPAYINIKFKDENGNSLKDVAKEFFDEKRAEKKLSTDPTVFINYCAEKPYEPNEAFNARGKNILPIKLAKEVLDTLVQTNSDRINCRYGDFDYLTGGVKFIPDANVSPYETYPVVSGDKEGCVVILKEPHRINGIVPDNLYTISVDPYSDEEATDSDSIGSFCVEENMNTITAAKGDLEVCWYDGRPEGHDGQDRFCKRLFAAAEYYNAKIVIENNEKGNVVHYARTRKDSRGRKLAEYLHEQLALGYDKSIATKPNMKREYGVHITAQRKLQGLKDYQEYLLRPRGIRYDIDGTEITIRNIHTINNRGLLAEIIAFKGDNADRISARIVKMFAMKEFEDKNKKIGTNKIYQDRFFSQPLFK